MNSRDKIPPDVTNKTTPTRRKLRSRFILNSQNSTRLQNGLDIIDEQEEEESDEDGSEEKDSEDDDSDEEDGEDDEYEQDFVDDDTEDSEDSRATYLPSTLNSDNDSNEEETGSGNESEALSLVEELKNLGITHDESNN